MKSSFFIGCIAAIAAATGFADSYEQWQSPWFTSIGSSPTLQDMKATNGTWTFPDSGDVAIENNKLVVDLVDETATFAVTAGKAQDTNTLTRLTFDAVVEPCLIADLPAVSDMTTDQAQMAFSVVTNTTGSTPLTYYAWTGDEWFALTGDVSPAADGALKLTAIINYRVSSSPTVSFYVESGSTLHLLSTNSVSEFEMSVKKTQISGFGLTGSATVTSVGGDVQLGVAQYDGVKYGTLSEAMTEAANDQTVGAEVKTVEVLRSTSENVVLPGSGIVVNDNGGKMTGTVTVPDGEQIDVAPTKDKMSGGKSGSYEVAVKLSLGTNSKVSVKLPDDMSNKEAYDIQSTDSKVTFKVQTAANVVTNAAPDGSTKLDANLAKLRTFLNTHANTAYEAADVSSASLATALQTTGGNGLALWKDYALGIEPTASVKPVTLPTGDTSTTAISLAIPSIDTSNYSGDYTVSYKVGDTEQSGPQSIQIPLSTGTGTHEVKVILTPNK